MLDLFQLRVDRRAWDASSVTFIFFGSPTPCLCLDLVTFGSIDEDSAMLPSSPTNLPSLKIEGVKSFGTIPVVNCGGMPSPFWDQQAGVRNMVFFELFFAIFHDSL